MRTLDALPPAKQNPNCPANAGDLRASREPTRHLAIQVRTEELAFRVIQLGGVHALTREFEKRAHDSAPFIEEVKAELLDALRMPVSKRRSPVAQKHIYSIYRKMPSKGRSDRRDL